MNIKQNGRTYRVDIEYDSDMGAPWEEQCGHRMVSNWTARDKRAGEWVLHADRHNKRFYDYAATIKKATSEGWGLSPEPLAALAAQLKREPTEREIVAESVRLDFNYLRGWCAEDWHWCGVRVTDEETGEDAALWGIDSTSEQYQQEVAQDLISELQQAHAIKNRFADAMACGV